MIRLVTGPLGTGKSYYAVRKAVEALKLGKMVVTNFAMADDWVEQVVTHGKLRKDSAKVRERVERFERRYHRVQSLDELMNLRLRPESPHAVSIGPDQWQLKEGSCVVLLDESHRWMNARGWSQSGREGILEFFALARKRGFHVYLISQRAENLDVQVRELFEDHIHLNNLRNSVRLLGMPVIPFNFFVAGWSNHAYPKETVKTERYRLNWTKRLYDTMDTASFGEGSDAGDDKLWLPRRAPTLDTDDGLPDGGAGAPAPPASPPPVANVARSGDPASVVIAPDPAL